LESTFEERRQSLVVLDVGNRNGNQEIAIGVPPSSASGRSGEIRESRACHDFCSYAGACTRSDRSAGTRALQSQLVADNAGSSSPSPLVCEQFDASESGTAISPRQGESKATPPVTHSSVTVMTLELGRELDNAESSASVLWAKVCPEPASEAVAGAMRLTRLDK
jgi:hypothetical protein